jgi:hypothetical protein
MTENPIEDQIEQETRDLVRAMFGEQAEPDPVEEDDPKPANRVAGEGTNPSPQASDDARQVVRDLFAS